jgi:dienelactone hydrolase
MGTHAGCTPSRRLAQPLVLRVCSSHFVARLTTAGALLTLLVPACRHSTPTPRGGQGTPPIVSPAPTVQWVKVSASGLGIMLAAVARPPGAGPFPAVILLHGTHGFARQYVELAQELSRGGLLAVAACWFSGGRGAGSRFVTPPIDCPEAPPIRSAASPEVQQTVDALVQATRTLPDARRDRVGLFGHSRGGGAVLNYVLRAGDVQAAVINSGGYPSRLADLTAQVRAPILILHGEADSPADGGSAFTKVEMAREFEAALRRSGKSVEAVYYETGGHNSIFTSATQHDDEVRRMVAFFQHHLGN